MKLPARRFAPTEADLLDHWMKDVLPRVSLISAFAEWSS